MPATSTPAYLRSVIGVLASLRGRMNDDVLIAMIDSCVCTLAGVISMTSPTDPPEKIAEILDGLGKGQSGNMGETSLPAPPDSQSAPSPP